MKDASLASLHSDEQRMADTHFAKPALGAVHVHPDGSRSSYMHWDTPQGKYTTVYKFNSKFHEPKMTVHRGSHLIPDELPY